MYAILLIIKISNSKTYAYINRELNLNSRTKKLQFFTSVVSLSWLSLVSKKGEFFKCIRPQCGFWIIYNNQIRD